MTSGSPLAIESVLIENFRPYQKLDIKLSTDKSKTITIIEGNNSLGKTTLMNALYWCLYGEEPFFLNQGEGKPLVNQKALNETQVGESLKAKVQIKFSNLKETTNIVSRELKLKRQDERTDKVFQKKVQGQIDSGFIIDEYITIESLQSNGNWKVTEDVNQSIAEINRIIPKELSEFIFFNGEMLDTFFRGEGQSKIRTGIEKVSGLEITLRSIEHWKVMEKMYKTKAANVAGSDVSEHERIKSEWEEKLERFISDRNLVQVKIDELTPKQKELENILQNHPLELINNLESQRRGLKEVKKTYENNKERINLERMEFIRSNFAPIILNHCILEAYEVIKLAETSGEIPPPISLPLLMEKIEEGFCICGNNLNKDLDAKIKLNKLIDDVKNSVLVGTAMEGKESLRRLLEIPNVLEIIEKLNKFRIDFNKADEDLQKTLDTITGITNQLKEYPQEKIRKFGNDLDEIDSKIRQYEKEIIQIESRIEAAKNTIDIKDQIITNSTKQSKASKIWNDKLALATKYREILEEIREELLGEIRGVVEKRTEEIWKRLISRGSQISKIEINEKYKIRVLDKENIDGLKTLSAGQTLYLALSFISAVREVTDINYPMVIDSPFGKVSGYERMWAADDLPNYLPQTQMTFLVTNSEYNAKIYDSATGNELPPISSVLRKNEKLWKEYVMKLKKISEESSITEIEEASHND